MSLLGKILAVLNILGAAAFVVFGFMDYSKREAWAYANYAYDVAFNGLPLDDKQLDDHESPLKYKLAKETKKDWFGDAPVSTQVEEVDRVKKAVDEKIASTAGGDPLKETVETARVLTPFARHDAEREWLLSVGRRSRHAGGSGEAPQAAARRLHAGRGRVPGAGRRAAVKPDDPSSRCRSSSRRRSRKPAAPRARARLGFRADVPQSPAGQAGEDLRRRPERGLQGRRRQGRRPDRRPTRGRKRSCKPSATTPPRPLRKPTDDPSAEDTLDELTRRR